MRSSSLAAHDFIFPAIQQPFLLRRTNLHGPMEIFEKNRRCLIGVPKRFQCARRDLDLRFLLTLLLFGLDLVFATGASFPFGTNHKEVRAQLSGRGHNVQPPLDGTLNSDASTSSVLEVFQVHQPVLTPFGPIDDAIKSDALSHNIDAESTNSDLRCFQVLMKYSFANSANKPFVGHYTPPLCKFNRVILNYTVTVSGIQYDRLGLMYFGDTEVWRSSTAEPLPSGVQWTYVKDMSEYLYFWNQPQKLIFDLANSVNSIDSGIYNTSLTAIFFFNGTENANAAPLIIPISARQSSKNQGSAFALPAVKASNTINFPQNANRAVFSVSVSGATDEEFWWNNRLYSNTSSIPLVSYSPWREVQVFIDGRLAGVEWPFPSIFTGGLYPPWWSPIVGIDAFDLREHEIDITPWLPLLCNGKKHTFEIKVAGLNEPKGSTITLAETVGSSWYVTGKIFVWLDHPSSITTGSMPAIIAPQPNITLSTINPPNGVSTTELLVNRSISISSTVETQHGTSIETWSQYFTYSSNQSTGSIFILGNGITITNGNDSSTGAHPYLSLYTYVISALTETVWTNLSRVLDIESYGNSIYPSGLEAFPGSSNTNDNDSPFSGWYLNTTQNASSSGSGFVGTVQQLQFGNVTAGKGKELYSRYVEAVDGAVIKDKKSIV